MTATQLEHGSVRIGDNDSLARLFQRQPLIDRDAVELTIELATEALLESVADKPVGMPEVFPLRHHPAGIHHWARPATAPSGSVPMAAAPLTLPTATEAAEPTPDVAPALHLAAIEADTDTDAVSVQVESTPEPPAATEPEFVATEPEFVATEPEFVAAEPEFVAAEPTFAATEPEFEIADPIFAATEPAELDAAAPAFEAAPVTHFEPLPLSAQIAETPTAGDTSEADTPTLQVPVLEADSSVFAPTPSSNGTHASWQPTESIFDRADDVTEAAATEQDVPESSSGFAPLPSTNGFGGRTLPSLTPLPPVEDHADEADTAMSEFGAAAATDQDEPAHAEPAPEAAPLNGFTALPTLGSMSSPAPEPEPVVDIFAPEAPAEAPTETALPSFSSLSSLQPLQPQAASEPSEAAAPEAETLPAPALPTLASLPTLGTNTAADFFDSLPEAGAYEPGVMPADLPKLASAPISMSDLAAANAEPAGPWNGATHNLAAVQIWEMVDDILDDGQSREPEMAAGAGSEKRGRGWLRGRKG